MTDKTKRNLGLGFAIVASLLMAASAADKISGSAHSIQMTTSFGIDPTMYRILGLIELSAATLFLFNRTGVLGTLLLEAYLGGAIATHLQHQQDILFPTAIQAFVWFTAWIRFPELGARLFGRSVDR